MKGVFIMMIDDIGFLTLLFFGVLILGVGIIGNSGISVIVIGALLVFVSIVGLAIKVYKEKTKRDD